jgi:Transmembrane secretion effector
VAQAILVLQLTHSGVWLGLATAAPYAPVLLLTPYASVIVDRQTKRRLTPLTQSSLTAVSLVLGALVLSGAIRLWMVFAAALAFGTLTALDNSWRLAFISEMVGQRLIRNASRSTAPWSTSAGRSDRWWLQPSSGPWASDGVSSPTPPASAQ